MHDSTRVSASGIITKYDLGTERALVWRFSSIALANGLQAGFLG